MGSFSFMKADTLTQVANIVYGAPYKLLIPKEIIEKQLEYKAKNPSSFVANGEYTISNGKFITVQSLETQLKKGYIKDYYQDYGLIGNKLEDKINPNIHDSEYQWDIYELLAIWNQDIFMFKKYEVMNGKYTGDIIDGVDMEMLRTTWKYPRMTNVLTLYLQDLASLYKEEDFQLVKKPLKEYLKGDIDNMFKPIDEYTDHNRGYGIDILPYDGIPRLTSMFGIKMVSCSYTGSYEDCDGFSSGDPEQGCCKIKRE